MFKVTIRIMDSKNINLINENNYLTTKAVDVSAIPTNTLQNDLQQLERAEEKSKYKVNIAKGEKDPLVYRAVSALRLKNPFKGY